MDGKSRECSFTLFWISLAFFGLVIILLSSVGIANLVGDIEEKELNNSYAYQYLERNQLKNETNFGMVEMPFFINENDYLFSKNSLRDSYSLISNFGEVEYECSGICFCENDEVYFNNDNNNQKNYYNSNERRRVGTIISEGVTYLLVAITSFVAYEKSKEYFSNECAQVLSGTCDHVKSSVVECSSISSTTAKTSLSSSTTEKLEDNRINPKSTGSDEDFSPRTYFCYGHCLNNSRIFKSDTLQKRQNIQCRKLKLEAEVVVHNEELFNEKTSPILSTRFVKTARTKFCSKFLKKFCRENSYFDYEYFTEVRGTIYSQLKQGIACVGMTWENQYKNVRCRQVDPLPANSNKNYWEKKFWEEKREWDKS